MLNLLISIIGTTYGRIMKQQNQNLVYERVNIISEMDKMSSDSTIMRLLKLKTKKPYLLVLAMEDDAMDPDTTPDGIPLR